MIEEVPYIPILALAFISGITTVFGVALAYLSRRNATIIVAGIGFSTGIMLLISFFELLPESVSTSSLLTTVIAALVGVSLAIILNRIIPHTHLVREEHHPHRKMSGRHALPGHGRSPHDCCCGEESIICF